jgi:hypothetical protein
VTPGDAEQGPNGITRVRVRQELAGTHTCSRRRGVAPAGPKGQVGPPPRQESPPQT